MISKIYINHVRFVNRLVTTIHYFILKLQNTMAWMQMERRVLNISTMKSCQKMQWSKLSIVSGRHHPWNKLRDSTSDHGSVSTTGTLVSTSFLYLQKKMEKFMHVIYYMSIIVKMLLPFSFHILTGQIPPPPTTTRVIDNNCIKYHQHPSYLWKVMVWKQIFAVYTLRPWPWQYDQESRSWYDCVKYYPDPTLQWGVMARTLF